MSAVFVPHRWTREQYEQLVRLGVFDPDQRVELIEGEIVDMVPQNEAHAVTLSLLDRVLRQAYGDGYVIRVQSPLALAGNSEPEPDIAVVQGDPRDFLVGHPHTAELIVEVAETTLAYDRTAKLAIYARNQIPEYWIVNLMDKVIEVYQEPHRSSYGRKTILKKGESLQPNGAGSVVKVSEALP